MPPAGIRRRAGRGDAMIEAPHGKPIPLLIKEGWPRHPKNSPVPKRRGRGGQFGENLRALISCRIDHYYGFALSRSRFAPVCGASVASQLFIIATATPPLRGGECTCPHFILTGANA